jgi:hypothetical protein
VQFLSAHEQTAVHFVMRGQVPEQTFAEVKSENFSRSRQAGDPKQRVVFGTMLTAEAYRVEVAREEQVQAEPCSPGTSASPASLAHITKALNEVRFFSACLARRSGTGTITNTRIDKPLFIS